MTLSTGEILNNRYRVVKQLGEGGFGTIYRIWDIQLNGPCVLKENKDVSPEAEKQFRNEARLLFNLRHPNLPRVFDHFILPGSGQYLVMDYIEGMDLEERLFQNRGPLPESTVLAWAGPVCSALEYLHSQAPPVIHRDLKPANIRLTPRGEVYLVDFGIAKIFDQHLKTTVGARAISPGYSPPEQYGRSSTDAQSDIYALGATLYTLLTNQRPGDSLEILLKHAPPAPPAARLNSAVSARTSQALERAMRLEKSDRFADVAELRRALLPDAAANLVSFPESRSRVSAAAAPPPPQAKTSAQPWPGQTPPAAPAAQPATPDPEPQLAAGFNPPPGAAAIIPEAKPAAGSTPRHVPSAPDPDTKRRGTNRAILLVLTVLCLLAFSFYCMLVGLGSVGGI